MNLHEVIQKIRDERLSVVQAAELLDLSRSQVHRLLRSYDLHGPAGLVSKKRSRPSNRRHSEDFRNAALDLIRERYLDFGPTLAREKLIELHRISVVLTDNRGYGCINRLQINCGGEEFNNMYKDCNIDDQPEIDYVAHAASMGAHAEKARDIADLEAMIIAARTRNRPSVIVIDTDAIRGPGEADGGHWWDVTVPEIGRTERIASARSHYIGNQTRQNLVN